MPDQDDDQIRLAKLAYDAYGETTDHKNYQGLPMPTWDALGDTIQGAWVSAVNAVVLDLMGPPPVDELSPGLSD